jgi:hypothetical protein
VLSSDESKFYKTSISLGNESCTCPAFTIQGKRPCKHIEKIKRYLSTGTAFPQVEDLIDANHFRHSTKMQITSQEEKDQLDQMKSAVEWLKKEGGEADAWFMESLLTKELVEKMKNKGMIIEEAGKIKELK